MKPSNRKIQDPIKGIQIREIIHLMQIQDQELILLDQLVFYLHLMSLSLHEFNHE